MDVSKEKKMVSVILIRSLYIVFAVMPFLLTLINTGAYLFKKRSAQPFIGTFLIILCVIMLGFNLCIQKMPEKINEKNNIYLMLLLFFLALFIRMLAVKIIRSQPVSDFFMAYDNAIKLTNGIIDPFYQERYGNYPYWGSYSLTLAILFKLFTPSVLTGQIFNCVVSSLTVILIYLTIKKICDSYRLGIVGAVLFLANPTVVIYNGVLTSEHIMMLNTCIIVYLLSECFYLKKAEKYNKRMILNYGFIGVLVGLIGTFKPIDIIFLISLFISEVMAFFYRNVSKKELIDKRKKLKLFLYGVGLFLGIVLISKTIITLNQSILNKVMDINKEEQFELYKGYGYAFLVGLGLEENGEYSGSISARDFIKKYNGTQENFSRDCLKEVVRCIQKYPDKYPELFWWKFTTTWGRYGRYPESAYIEWSFYPTAVLEQKQSGQHPMTEEYYDEISTLLGQYYFMLMGFAFLGVIGMLREKINYCQFFCVLTVFGFILMTFLSEAQMRYRSIFFPYISILAAIGVNYFIKFIHFIPVFFKSKVIFNVHGRRYF